MKILHCADIHLDSAMTANLDKDKARERRNELLASFKDMVGYAVKERIGVIIIAGDLFVIGSQHSYSEVEFQMQISGNAFCKIGRAHV